MFNIFLHYIALSAIGIGLIQAVSGSPMANAQADRMRPKDWIEYYDSVNRSYNGQPVAAIAVSKKRGSTIYSWAKNRTSLSVIERGAFLECSKLADDCETVISWGNGCGAVAVGQNNIMGWASAAISYTVNRLAIEHCSGAGPNCKVVETICTD
jgi:Domain of unknown function (DUF4189)